MLAANNTADIIQNIKINVLKACNNIVVTKSLQSVNTNYSWIKKIEYYVSDEVLLFTYHCCREYMQRKNHYIVKFMVRWNRSYKMTRANLELSSYTLELLSTMNIFSTFHSFLLKSYHQNSTSLFPSCMYLQSDSVILKKASRSGKLRGFWTNRDKKEVFNISLDRKSMTKTWILGFSVQKWKNLLLMMSGWRITLVMLDNSIPFFWIFFFLHIVKVFKWERV